MSSAPETLPRPALGPVVGAFVFGIPVMSVLLVALFQHWGR